MPLQGLGARLLRVLPLLVAGLCLVLPEVALAQDLLGDGALDIARAAAHGGELGIVVVTTDWRCARNPKLRRRATALARCMYAWMTLKTLRSRLHPANLPGPPLALVRIIK